VLSPTPVPQLEAKVLAGVRWVAIGQIATQTGRFAVSVVLARLLAPSEFGLMAMAAVITTVASLFPTLGTAQAIVQRRELPQGLLRSLATVGLVTGVTLSAILAVGAWSMANTLFAEPRVASIVAVLGIQFTIQSLSIVPENLMQREMQLNRLVAIDVANLVVSSSIAVGLALNGWGVWALVTANLVGALVRTVAILFASPWRLKFGFDLNALRGVAGFSASVMASNLVNYAARFTDRIAIGRLLGVTSLGFYDYACRLYWYPMEAVTPVLLGVMFPAFSKIQDDNAKLGRAFLRANGLIALVVCPIMIGLAAVADPFIPVLLGERWRPLVPLVEILAPAGILAALGVTQGHLFLAKGKATLRLYWSLIGAAVSMAAVLIGVSGGIHGVAIALACVRIPLTIIGFALALRLVQMSVLDIWRTVRSAVMLAVIMGAAVAALRWMLLQTVLSPVVVLLICVVFGALVYGAGVHIHPPRAVHDFYRLLPASLQRRPFVAWLFMSVDRPA